MGEKSFISRALEFLYGSKKSHETKVGGTGSTEGSVSASSAGVSSSNEETASSAAESSNEYTATSSTAYTGNQSFRYQTAQSSQHEQPAFTPANVMKALGVEILETGKDGYYMVGFQGGAFVFYFEDNRLNAMYNDVVECSYSDTVKAALVANEINSSFVVWSCYLHSSTSGTSDLPVKVCFSQMFPLFGDFRETINFIHDILASVFSIGREFRERFRKAQKEHANLSTLLNQRDFVYKLELAKRMMEVQNFDEIKEEMPPASYLRIETLADLFDDTEFGLPISLKVVGQNGMESITAAEDVKNFDIRSYVRSLPNPETLTQLTLIAVFEKQDLIVSLKQLPGSSPKSLFFALNVMRSGVEDDIISRNRAIISCRDTIEIRLTTEQEDYWEVKYMIDEARDKHTNKDISSLSDEQKMMLIQLAPNAQDDLYWGFKFFNQDCLYQSLYYFKRIYYNYCIPGKNGKKDEKILSDICLYIGIAYCQLKRYELAYYFLDRTRKYDSILASEWYVNCLCSLNDVKALTYIHRMIEMVKHNLEDNDLDAAIRDDFYTYYLFLKRRLLQTLINEYRLTEAEYVATEMIDKHENVDFCKKELEKIKRYRMEDAKPEDNEDNEAER